MPVKPVNARKPATPTESAEMEAKHRGLVARIQKLPTGVGVMLMGVGVAGLVLPGPFGTPFILAGGMVLAPKMFGACDRFVERRMPSFYWTGMEVVHRFLEDMDKRYPPEDPKVGRAQGHCGPGKDAKFPQKKESSS